MYELKAVLGGIVLLVPMGASWYPAGEFSGTQ